MNWKYGGAYKISDRYSQNVTGHIEHRKESCIGEFWCIENEFSDTTELSYKLFILGFQIEIHIVNQKNHFSSCELSYKILFTNKNMIFLSKNKWQLYYKQIYHIQWIKNSILW